MACKNHQSQSSRVGGLPVTQNQINHRSVDKELVDKPFALAG